MIPPLLQDGVDVVRGGLHARLWRGLRPRPTARLLLELAQGRRDLYAAVAKHAREQPDAVAARDRSRVLTWAELQEQAERVAQGLAERGVQPRQRVALVQANRVEHLVAMAGVLSLGAVPAPMSPSTGADELALRLGAGGFAAAVVEAGLVQTGGAADALRRLRAPVISMEPASGTVSWAELLASPRRRPPRLQDRRGRGQPNMLLYTSGTTGGAQRAGIDMQKARVGTAFRYLRAFDLRRGDRLYTSCPVYHAAPMLLTGLCMLVGAQVVLDADFDPARLVEDVHGLGLTHVFAVPTLLGRLAASPELPRLRGSSLRALISGGAALRPDLKRTLLSGAGPVLYDFYGATELGVVTVASPRDLQRCPEGVGRPLPGIEVRLVDEQGRLVAPGERGVLYVRSDATNRFEGDAAAPPGLEGFVTAGDVARFEGDQLCIVDRVKDIIVTGGVNVFPGAVERVLARHPDVADVAVAGVPDDEWGEAVVAFVVPRPGATLDPEALRAHARAHLAPAQVPKRVVRRDALPLGSTGKVLRRALVDEVQAADRATSPARGAPR